MAAYGLDASTETPKHIRDMLEGGVQDPASPANQLTDKRYANFVAAFDFEQYGDQATSRDAALKETPALYVGKSNVGLHQAERRLRQGRDRLLSGQRLQAGIRSTT